MTTNMLALFSMRYAMDNDHPLTNVLIGSLFRMCEDDQISREVQDEIFKEVHFRVNEWKYYKKDESQFLAHPLGSDRAGELWHQFRQAIGDLRSRRRAGSGDAVSGPADEDGGIQLDPGGEHGGL